MSRGVRSIIGLPHECARLRTSLSFVKILSIEGMRQEGIHAHAYRFGVGCDHTNPGSKMREKLISWRSITCRATPALMNVGNRRVFRPSAFSRAPTLGNPFEHVPERPDDAFGGQVEALWKFPPAFKFVDRRVRQGNQFAQFGAPHGPVVDDEMTQRVVTGRFRIGPGRWTNGIDILCEVIERLPPACPQFISYDDTSPVQFRFCRFQTSTPLPSSSFSKKAARIGLSNPGSSSLTAR